MSILRVKDEHGNWIDIPALKGEPGKDGQPGKDGKDGQPGENYVLTDADKQEIADLVMASANIAYVGSVMPVNDLGKDGDIYIVSG